MTGKKRGRPAKSLVERLQERSFRPGRYAHLLSSEELGERAPPWADQGRWDDLRQHQHAYRQALARGEDASYWARRFSKTAVRVHQSPELIDLILSDPYLEVLAGSNRYGMVDRLQVGVDDLGGCAPFWHWLLKELGYRPEPWQRPDLGYRNAGFRLILTNTPTQTATVQVGFRLPSRRQVDRISREAVRRGAQRLDRGHRHAGLPQYFTLLHAPGGPTIELTSLDR